jgi:hypothetical protein
VETQQDHSLIGSLFQLMFVRRHPPWNVDSIRPIFVYILASRATISTQCHTDVRECKESTRASLQKVRTDTYLIPKQGHPQGSIHTHTLGGHRIHATWQVSMKQRGSWDKTISVSKPVPCHSSSSTQSSQWEYTDPFHLRIRW